MEERKKWKRLTYWSSSTSYEIVPPEDAGCLRVTKEIVPQPDNMQTALGLCWAKDNIFAATSCDIRFELLSLKKEIPFIEDHIDPLHFS